MNLHIATAISLEKLMELITSENHTIEEKVGDQTITISLIGYPIVEMAIKIKVEPETENLKSIIVPINKTYIVSKSSYDKMVIDIERSEEIIKNYQEELKNKRQEIKLNHIYKHDLTKFQNKYELEKGRNKKLKEKFRRFDYGKRQEM